MIAMRTRSERNHTVVGKLKLVRISGENFEVAKKRMVRVWFPSDYDGKRKDPFDVLYMFDGQNLFDEATSYIGVEWSLDETIEKYIKLGLRSKVVVGLDCSSNRDSEYTPTFGFDIDQPFDALGERGIFPRGEMTIDFLVNRVIPYIEQTYNVGRSKERRGIGGSSLGSLMALAGATAHPELFRDILAFSTPFHLYHDLVKDDRVYQRIIEVLTDSAHLNCFGLVLTSGGRGFEKDFMPYVKKLQRDLVTHGYDPGLIKAFVNKKFSHNERQWAYYFDKAYRFISR